MVTAKQAERMLRALDRQVSDEEYYALVGGFRLAKPKWYEEAMARLRWHLMNMKEDR